MYVCVCCVCVCACACVCACVCVCVCARASTPLLPLFPLQQPEVMTARIHRGIHRCIRTYTHLAVLSMLQQQLLLLLNTQKHHTHIHTPCGLEHATITTTTTKHTRIHIHTPCGLEHGDARDAPRRCCSCVLACVLLQPGDFACTYARALICSLFESRVNRERVNVRESASKTREGQTACE